MADREAEIARASAAARPMGVSGLEAFLLRERSTTQKLIWLVIALAVASLARWLAGYFTGGLPLIFYMPVLVFLSLIGGWRYGLASLVIATPLGWLLFGPPTMFQGASTWATELITLIIWILVGAVLIATLHFVRLALTGAQQNEIRFRKLLGATSGLVLATDAKGYVQVPQAGWTDITGMPWPDYAGHGWLKAIHPDDVSRFVPDRAIPHDEFYSEVEIRLWSASAADWRWYNARGVPVHNLHGGVEWIAAMREIHDQKLAEDKRDLVIGELRHRMKNLVAVIDALARGSNTANEPAVNAFLTRFSGRLHALGAAADLVLAGQRVAIECGAVIRAALAPFTDENANRITAEGPQIQLGEAVGGSIGMAMHELATNAIKYGALSVPNGKVTVTWAVTPLVDGERVVIDWRESGGPRPVPPNREGYGSRVIRAAAAQERQANVNVDYAAEGLHCRITFVKDAEGPPASAAAD